MIGAFLRAKILNFAVPALVVLIVLEMILHFIFPLNLAGGYIGRYKYDDQLGYVIKEGYWTKTSDYKQEVMVNGLGTVNFQDNFASYKELVFALGDSYTQGTGLPVDASYPAQLDLMLNIPDGTYKKLYGVVNLGLAAFGGSQNILTYAKYKEKLGAPKYIIYLGCDNDIFDDALFVSGAKHRNLVEGSPHYGIFQKPLMYLLNDTEIGKRLNYLRRTLYRQKIAGAEVYDSALKSQLPHLEKLINDSSSDGSILLVSWADTPNDSKSYSQLKTWASQNKVIFVDWYPTVESV